jgi:hypothetical protein
MTMRSFASTIVASSSWIGFAVLFPIGAALLAAAFWAEIAQLLFGLADLACAPCVDPSEAIPGAAAAAGTAGAGAAAGGAAAGGGGLGGGPTPPYSYGDPGGRDRHGRNPRIPDPTDDVGDQTPWKTLPTRPTVGPWEEWYLHTSDRLQKWAEDMIGGVEQKGTAPSSGKA